MHVSLIFSVVVFKFDQCICKPMCVSFKLISLCIRLHGCTPNISVIVSIGSVFCKLLMVVPHY